MRTPRWALALMSVTTVGGVALVGLPIGSAQAAPPADVRYQLSAQGDAMFYQVKSNSIPASPDNTASSLYTFADIGSNGGSTAQASSPFFGSTVQNLPGTANGVPPGFGLPGVAFPFTRLPGFIEARGAGDSAQEDGGFYRISVKTENGSAEAHGEQGAPPPIPAPNQQETADAVVSVANNGTATAEAEGSASGFVMGPLEVGSSLARATITDTVQGEKPKIDAATFGKFSVGGQEFGYNQDGFFAAGQGMDKASLEQANDALKAAGIQLDVGGVETAKDDATGATSYLIGGLKVTTTQAVPGAEPLTISYILGRAKVTAVSASLGADVTDSTETGTANSGANSNAGNNNAGSNNAGVTDAGVTDTGTTDSTVPSTDLGITPTDTAPITEGADLGTLPGATDGAVAPSTDTGAVVAPAAPAGAELPKTLGFVNTGATGDNQEWLYAMLVLAGVGVLGGHFLFSRFAVAARGA